MAPRPIRISYRGQILTVEYDDSDEFDSNLLQAQIYSLTNINPDQQQFQPELSFSNVDQTLALSCRAQGSDLDPQLVLSSIEWESCCSRIWLGDAPVVQPAAVASGDRLLCLPCAASCWQQVELQPSQKLDGFACQCQDRCLFKSRVVSKDELLIEPFRNILVQAFGQRKLQHDKMMLARGNASFLNRMQSNQRQIADFEDPENQRRALAAIPLQTLLERSKARGPEALNPRDELVFQLLYWFKHEFFQWVNSPACGRCGHATSAKGHAAPSADERRFGAGVTELHQCDSCGFITRFPRYNHSGKLMETRQGRCGEWAQAFVLCCRALKFETRFVVDWTDHVWAEVYSEAEQRWVHCDPCENRYDAPLLYEAGWGKKLTYVIAFSVDEVRDVTRRYTAQYQTQVQPRRTACDKEWLSATLDHLNREIQSKNQCRASRVQQRWEQEIEQLEGRPSSNATALPGRTTGSVEWRRARGELGSAKHDTTKLTKEQLQDLVKAYFVQISSGCGNSDCPNRGYCASAKGSTTVKPLPRKEVLSQSIVAVRECLDSKLCSKSNPL